MQVPFVNLTAQYEVIKEEIDEAIFSVLQSGHYVKHKFVSKFEESFARKLGVKHCISVGSGTDALLVSLKSLGVSAGDEVLTPALSWISTAEVISLLGAKPVFVDVDPDYFTINLRDAEKRITPKTKAIIAVHLYGQVVKLNVLNNFCLANNLRLVEDCAQAHFSADENTMTGTVGNVNAFSFYPTKNLGAYGDAGCVITNNDAVAIIARRFSNHGGLSKNEHLLEGINSRMDELQASILLKKLNHIDHWNIQRNQKADLYRKYLNSVGVILPQQLVNTFHTYHQFVIKVQRRDDLRTYLSSKGIETEIHYPTALPFEPAYQFLNHSVEDFPIAYQLQQQILSLPIYPELSREAIEYVCASINEFYQSGK